MAPPTPEKASPACSTIYARHASSPAAHIAFLHTGDVETSSKSQKLSATWPAPDYADPTRSSSFVQAWLFSAPSLGGPTRCQDIDSGCGLLYRGQGRSSTLIACARPCTDRHGEPDHARDHPDANHDQHFDCRGDRCPGDDQVDCQAQRFHWAADGTTRQRPAGWAERPGLAESPELLARCDAVRR